MNRVVEALMNKAFALLLAVALAIAACGSPSGQGQADPAVQGGRDVSVDTGVSTGAGADGSDAPAADPRRITLRGDGIDGEMVLALADLLAMPDAVFEHVYSTINNWPTPRFYAGRGVRVAAALEAAGVLDTARLITFRSYDSYEITLTRRQLLEDAQYCFPFVAEGGGEGAQRVEPILAYEFKEGSDDLGKAAQDNLCLIIGQRNHLEHTNPAFVEDLKEIVVSAEAPGRWADAAIFPASGRIAAGESIKLQHPDFGLVKMHYTLDGTNPTELSAMYNPSTYQPELNKPIVFAEGATLKVLVVGFGREDSAIAVFDIEVQ
jgi:hypothetical protein